MGKQVDRDDDGGTKTVLGFIGTYRNRPRVGGLLGCDAM
jgi:hypothetical protein